MLEQARSGREVGCEGGCEGDPPADHGADGARPRLTTASVDMQRHPVTSSASP